MKNVTIALDERTLRESHARSARRRIAELCRDSNAEVGERNWTRDELHER